MLRQRTTPSAKDKTHGGVMAEQVNVMRHRPSIAKNEPPGPPIAERQRAEEVGTEIDSLRQLIGMGDWVLSPVERAA
jgi:hypothetical protein